MPSEATPAKCRRMTISTNSSAPMASRRPDISTSWPRSPCVIGPSMIDWITFGIDAAAARPPSWETPNTTTRKTYGRMYGT